jgi:hypothetical protein
MSSQLKVYISTSVLKGCWTNWYSCYKGTLQYICPVVVFYKMSPQSKVQISTQFIKDSLINELLAPRAHFNIFLKVVFVNALLA